ncbi:hypothetical protein [Carboxylicivirga marina]|uniref:hypothetical protein n=1 Tax=Carboxylicivirga marina TaxID=2800988 RepID=UPI002595E122|nr:hypothetical protein [uncultured Carboxylicivirga sp.]
MNLSRKDKQEISKVLGSFDGIIISKSNISNESLQLLQRCGLVTNFHFYPDVVALNKAEARQLINEQ